MSNRRRPYRQAPPPAPAPKKPVEIGATSYRDIRIAFSTQEYDAGTECTASFFLGEHYSLMRRVTRMQNKGDAFDDMTKEAKQLIDTKLEAATPSSA